MLFPLWSSSLEIIELSRRELITHYTPIFYCHKEGIYEEVLGFSALPYWQF